LVVGGQDGLSVVELKLGAVLATLAITNAESERIAKQAIEQVKKEIAAWDADDVAKQCDQAVNRAIASLKKMGVPDVAQKAAKIREEMEDTYRSLLDGSAFRAVGRSERVVQLQFDAAGERLFCATNDGVRVFAWDDLLAATRAAPPPLLKVESEPVEMESGTLSYTYALAHDVQRDRLVFGGLGGTFRFLDLDTGESGTLLEIPGKPAILAIGLSSDSSAICCTCHPGFPAGGEEDEPPRFQVWDYPKISN